MAGVGVDQRPVLAVDDQRDHRRERELAGAPAQEGLVHVAQHGRVVVVADVLDQCLVDDVGDLRHLAAVAGDVGQHHLGEPVDAADAEEVDVSAFLLLAVERQGVALPAHARQLDGHLAGSRAPPDFRALDLSHLFLAGQRAAGVAAQSGTPSAKSIPNTNGPSK